MQYIYKDNAYNNIKVQTLDKEIYLTGAGLKLGLTKSKAIIYHVTGKFPFTSRV